MATNAEVLAELEKINQHIAQLDEVSGEWKKLFILMQTLIEELGPLLQQFAPMLQMIQGFVPQSLENAFSEVNFLGVNTNQD